MSSISPSALYGASASPDAAPPASYTLNSSIMVAAIIVLFFVVSIILMLHLYARWFLHRSYITSRVIPFGPGAHHGAASTLAANTGLDKAVLAQLPTFVFVKAPAPASTENLEAAQAMKDLSSAPVLECAVCLSEFGDGEKGRILPSCKHAFHVECIDMWFHSHSSCPLCRTVVSPSPTTITHEQTQMEGETAQAGSMEAATAFSDGNADGTPASMAVQYPCNVLFYGTQAQVTSHMIAGKYPSTSSHLHAPRSSSGPAHRMLHITIDAPSTTQGNSVISPSPKGGEQAACTSQQPLKSPSLRLSIKRMLSRQSSRQRSEGSEEYQKGTTSAV